MRQEVEGAYTLNSKHQVAFRVAAYDESKPLIIDPVLVYSTYHGGGRLDSGSSIALDSEGNAYITGITESVDFPTTSGAGDTTCGTDGDCNFDTYVPFNLLGPFDDVFVAKFSPDGSELVYSTYLGGSLGDGGNDLAIDDNGNAYIVGLTYSFDFPTTNSFQSVYNGSSDAFVAKLNATGSALIYSTFLGGIGRDGATGIVVDPSGNAYVSGFAQARFPTTPGAFQPDFGGVSDAFVSKLSEDGSMLLYSTYLGSSEPDGSNDIAVDTGGNAYVTGSTEPGYARIPFPTTPGAFQSETDCCPPLFVAKLNSTGSDLIYSSQFGKIVDSDYSARAIAVDSFGNAYVTGSTNSTEFPTTPGAFQTTTNGFTDAFVTKFNADGSDLVYSTYLGGSRPLDEGRAIAVDSFGNAYVGGRASRDFPTARAIQLALPESPSGGFVTVLNATGSGLDYSTYILGGTPNGIAVDTEGNAYVAGSADNSYFPTVNPIQSAPNGRDSFVLKITPSDAPVVALGPGSLSFPAQLVGTTSTEESVIVTNAGGVPLTITGIAVSGDFAQTNTCTGALAPGTACRITVTFLPSITGVRTGAISITDSTPDNPHSVALTGIGSTEPAVTLSFFSRRHLDFGRQLVGRVLDDTDFESISISNSGVVDLHISGFSFGGAHPEDFVKILDNCVERSIPPGELCNVRIQFVPTVEGIRSATLFITDDAPDSPQSISLTGSGVLPPAINPNGVVGGASFTGPLAPGQIASLFGTNLSPIVLTADSVPLATSLLGVGVAVGRPASLKSAALFYVSPTQINFQVPWEIRTDGLSKIVEVGIGLGPQYAIFGDIVRSERVSFSLKPYAPGIFTLGTQANEQGAILIASSGEIAAPNGSIPGRAARPANRGEFITIYCTGLGPVTNQPETGMPASADPLSETTTSPTVTIAGIPAAVTFSGLAPGFVGLYQVNAEVPENTTTGDAAEVVLRIGDATSNAVTIAVQ